MLPYAEAAAQLTAYVQTCHACTSADLNCSNGDDPDFAALIQSRHRWPASPSPSLRPADTWPTQKGSVAQGAPYLV